MLECDPKELVNGIDENFVLVSRINPIQVLYFSFSLIG